MANVFAGDPALSKWRKIVCIKKILRRCTFPALILVFWALVGYLWQKAADFRFDFASSMAKFIGNIMRFFGSAPDNLIKSCEIVVNVALLVVLVILFIYYIKVIHKVRKMIIRRKIDEYTERFKNIGLINRNGRTPQYNNKDYDPNRINGEIYSFEDADIDITILDDPKIVRGLRNIFRGFVLYDVETYGKIILYVTPSEKVVCTPLTYKDTFIVEHINAAGAFGAPGTGKTVGLAFLMWLYCLDADAREIDIEFVLFYQKLTFAQKLGVADSSSFYYGERVFDGLENAVATLDKIKLNPDGKTRVYILDEMITFLERLDRKQADRAKSLLATLVFEGREYNFKVILAGQSSHAERFSAGVRDSLTTKFVFGSLSETEKRMLFPSDVGLMDAHNSIGEGYFRIDAVMPHVERFSIKDAVPDFAVIGEMVRKYMR